MRICVWVSHACGGACCCAIVRCVYAVVGMCVLPTARPATAADARRHPRRFAKTRRRSCRMLSTAMSASAPKRRSKTSTTRARARATKRCGRKPGRWFTVAIVPYRRRRSARRCCQVRMWARVRLHSSPVVQAQRKRRMERMRGGRRGPGCSQCGGGGGEVGANVAGAHADVRAHATYLHAHTPACRCYQPCGGVLRDN